MAGIDKAAIAFSVAIVAIGVGAAFYLSAVQDAAPVVSTPSVSTKTIEPTTPTDPFADIADKVKQEAPKVEKEKMTEKPQEEPIEKAVEIEEETMMEEPAGPTTHTVEMPEGTSVPGCEESNACYSPADITINAGDTVNWINVDTAAHTVTSGSPADGPSGVFDSSLVMANAEFAFTFNDSGSYDYFCMVHPWMVGSVTVTEQTVEVEVSMEETMMEETHEEETMMEETHEEETMMEEPAGPTTHTVEMPEGTSVPGCEESNACYSPADITINAGDTVNWINVDTAAHTVTSGSPADGPSGVFDSSLVMANAEFAFTFNDSGSYDYFCMVHPWMVGSVTVN